MALVRRPISRSYRYESEIKQPPRPDIELVNLPSVNPGKLRYNDFARSGARWCG